MSKCRKCGLNQYGIGHDLQADLPVCHNPPKGYEIIEDYPGYGVTTGAWIVAPTPVGIEMGVKSYCENYPAQGYGTHLVGEPKWNEPKKNYWQRVSRSAQS